MSGSIKDFNTNPYASKPSSEKHRTFRLSLRCDESKLTYEATHKTTAAELLDDTDFDKKIHFLLDGILKKMAQARA